MSSEPTLPFKAATPDTAGGEREEEEEEPPMARGAYETLGGG